MSRLAVVALTLMLLGGLSSADARAEDELPVENCELSWAEAQPPSRNPQSGNSLPKRIVFGARHRVWLKDKYQRVEDFSIRFERASGGKKISQPFFSTSQPEKRRIVRLKKGDGPGVLTIRWSEVVYKYEGEVRCKFRVRYRVKAVAPVFAKFKKRPTVPYSSDVYFYATNKRICDHGVAHLLSKSPLVFTVRGPGGVMSATLKNGGCKRGATSPEKLADGFYWFVSSSTSKTGQRGKSFTVASEPRRAGQWDFTGVVTHRGKTVAAWRWKYFARSGMAAGPPTTANSGLPIHIAETLDFAN